MPRVLAHLLLAPACAARVGRNDDLAVETLVVHLGVAYALVAEGDRHAVGVDFHAHAAAQVARADELRAPAARVAVLLPGVAVEGLAREGILRVLGGQPRHEFGRFLQNLGNAPGNKFGNMDFHDFCVFLW